MTNTSVKQLKFSNAMLLTNNPLIIRKEQTHSHNSQNDFSSEHPIKVKVKQTAFQTSSAESHSIVRFGPISMIKTPLRRAWKHLSNDVIFLHSQHTPADQMMISRLLRENFLIIACLYQFICWILLESNFVGNILKNAITLYFDVGLSILFIYAFYSHNLVSKLVKLLTLQRLSEVISYHIISWTVFNGNITFLYSVLNNRM